MTTPIEAPLDQPVTPDVMLVSVPSPADAQKYPYLLFVYRPGGAGHVYAVDGVRPGRRRWLLGLTETLQGYRVCATHHRRETVIEFPAFLAWIMLSTQEIRFENLSQLVVTPPEKSNLGQGQYL